MRLCSKCEKFPRKAYTSWCTKCCTQNVSNCRKKNPIGYSFSTYKGNAKRQGREFTIDREQFNALVMGNCVYSGHPPNPVNGIDRVNNALGYVPGNVVTCCHICNVAKSTLPSDAFIRRLDDVARFRAKVAV